MKHKYISNIIYKRVYVLILCISLITTGPVLTTGLAVTQSDLDKTNSELAELRKQQAALSDDYAELNSMLDTASKQLSSIENRITAAISEISAIEDEIANLNHSINSQYESMKLRIKYMYEVNERSLFDMLLTSHSIAEFLSHTEYILQLSIYDRNQLAEYQDSLNTLSSKKASLDAQLETLISLKAEAQAETDKITALLANKKALINSNNMDIDRLLELALDYEKKLEQQKADAEADSSGSIPNLPDISDDRGSGNVTNYTQTDLDMLAAIIECEANIEPYEGLIAVGSVIINRVKDPRFPNTLSGVIFSPGQFTPVASGRFAIVYARGANERCYQAAREVLEGRININALYFHTYRPERNETGTIIGTHIFM